MDNLADILSRKDLNEPSEIKIIKDFVKNKYNEVIRVKVETNKIVIYADGSALASSISMDIPQIQTACNSDKRIVIYPSIK